jgi:hypothetical protein
MYNIHHFRYVSILFHIYMSSILQHVSLNLGTKNHVTKKPTIQNGKSECT